MIEKSFLLVRTNPALTGNVKLVVSSDYKLYLESFDINKSLSQDRFRHFEIKKEEYYKEVIPHFFKDVESNAIFEIKDNRDASEMHTDYRLQFDDRYYSGAFFTEDTWHQEEYEYFAPLYLKPNKLPKNFIILRVDGAGMLNEESNAGNFRANIVDKWKFVSMFDLTPESDLGMWLHRNYIKDEGMPKHPLYVKHGEAELSEVSGIDVKFGGWATRYTNLHDFQTQNTPIFKTEEYITKLWENQNVLYPHILNMKFLFNDTPATHTSLKPYTLNRYVGFYLDDMVNVKNVSPYEGIVLNKASNLKDLSHKQVSEIPFLKDNAFVREVNGRLYSFDPIKKGWLETQTYWVEWESVFYRIERVTNTTDQFSSDAIIGDYLYRVVSKKNIECELVVKNSNGVATVERWVNGLMVDAYENFPAPKGRIDEKIITQLKKVLINDLTTGKDKISIKALDVNNNISNIIENINTQHEVLKRVDYKWEGGRLLFRLDVDADIDNNLFDIPNFNEADLHLMKMGDDYHIIKQYPSNTPNVGGKYYIQSDWALDVDDKAITSWINNGNITKQGEYYKHKNIESIGYDKTPPYFEILRVNFSDINDFDFDRVDTDYANYEYEKKYELTPSKHVEPKLYAKEHRDMSIKIRTLAADVVRRVPILDINNRPYKLREGELNTFTGKSYTAEELFRTEYDGTWSLFEGVADGKTWQGYRDKIISVNREFYREEDYIWRIENNNHTYELDFKSNSNAVDITQNVKWVDENGVESATGAIGISQGINSIKAKADPNQVFDPNYIPVSSEYIASDELWEIRNNDLTAIWAKNQSVCKWGFANSNGLHDYPYRLNYSLDMTGMYNREPNPFGLQETPLRKHFDLEYFYRFGISNAADYDFYSLHLKDTVLDQMHGFNVDRYISSEFDYFEYVLKSDQEVSDGLLLNRKYSSFVTDNEFGAAHTVFRGIKYSLLDVHTISKEVDESNGAIIIDDIATKANSTYEDYKFSVVFSRKSSGFNFNAGTGSSNSGMDVYLNDVWKNVVIHLYIDTEETLEISDESEQIFNAETCPIDLWYQDSVTMKEMDVAAWERSEFKISGLGLGIRPRDFMLSRFLLMLNNYNYAPSDNKNPVNFIHIYNDGREPKIMSYENTDFVLKTELPVEFLTREKSYETVPVSVSKSILYVNNSLKNRIVLDDDINSIGGSAEFTSDGVKVGTLADLNTYNSYPVARRVVKASDLKPYWQLSELGDPSFYRYSGVYTPIFKRIPMFRPLGYNALVTQGKTPVLPVGNWKFYDSKSGKDKPNLVQFATINELVFSKCNPTSNVLKIQNLSGGEKSIYPMVDEYGYDFDSRYLFASSWEPAFHYLSRRVEVEPNQYAGIAGYALEYNGVRDFLRIQDSDKFNLERFLVEDTNYSNFILNEPEGERSFFRKTLLSVTTETRSFNMKLLVDQEYRLSLAFHNYKGDGTDKLKYTIEVINDPTDATQTGQLFLLNQQLDSIPNSTPSHVFNTNVTKAYKYDNTVNVRISFQIIGDNTAKVDVYPMSLELSNNTMNFLDLSLYSAAADNVGMAFINDVGVWGGYLRRNGATPDVGEVSDFPVKLTQPFQYSTYALLVSNLNSILSPKGFTVSNAISSKTNPIIRIAHEEPFTFEPERWTNIEDGRSITYVGEKYGDSTITPSHKLKWFTAYKPENKKVITKKIFKYENEQGRLELEPKPMRMKSPFMAGRFKPVPVEHDTPFNYNGGNIRLGASIHDVVEHYESYRKVDSEYVDFPRFIQPLGKITFVPSAKFLPFPLPKPQIESEEIVSYESSMVEQLPETIAFEIIPDNGHPISVSVSSMHPEDGSALPVHDVIGLINNIVTPEYLVSEVTAEHGVNYKIIEIKSAYSGSHYNFKIQESSSHIEIISSKLATEEVTISEKFTKTSLKNDSLRKTGYVADYTVEFYVKLGAWHKEYETIFYKGEDGKDPWADESFDNFTMVIGRDKNTDLLAFRTCHKQLDGTVEKHTLLSNSVIADGNWHHVAFVVNSTKRRKTIYVDKKIDASTTDFLSMAKLSPTISQREMVASFLDHQKRFFVGANNIAGFDTLAATIRSGGSDYWFDAIRGYRELNFWDKHAQIKNVGTTVDVAFKAFHENYESLSYYLNASVDNTWHILLATDNSVELGKRNFNGALDELRVWNYARSYDHITSNANFILRPESYLDPLKSLTAYYRFDGSKGDQNVKDLMGGKAVSDIVKWCKVKTQFIYDGNSEVEKDEITYYLFDSAFYAGADAQINIDRQSWVVSGANLIGFSDERYTVQAPPPFTKELTDVVDKPVFPKSKYVLEKAKAPTVNIDEHVVKSTKTHTGDGFKTERWRDSLPSVKSKSKKNWFQRVIEPIIQPKKVIASIAKAPANALKALKGLFKKRK
jgi:hypothetical protein